ncbi:MAG: hypothetical protein ACRDDY_14075 [Clostridium sp.]
MIDFDSLSENASCIKIGAGFYQRLKEIGDISTLKTLLNVTGEDIYLRLGQTYQSDLGSLRKAYIEKATDELNYISYYLIHANSHNSFSVYMHGMMDKLYRWDIPFKLLSPVIFSYYSSPDDITYEQLLDDICIRRHTCTR